MKDLTTPPGTTKMTNLRLHTNLAISRQKNRDGSLRIVVRQPETGRMYAFSATTWTIIEALGMGMSTQTALDSLRSFSPTPGLVSDPAPNPAPAQLIHQIDKIAAQATLAKLLIDEAQPAQSAPPATAARRVLFNPFFLRIPLPGIAPLLHRLSLPARAAFSRPGVLVWSLLVVSTAAICQQQWPSMLRDFSRLGAVRPWFELYWLLPLATFVHEAGHVLACERFGVRVREVGLLFYLFQPGAYADISEAWMLPSKRERIVITLGGIYFESVLLCLALLAWSQTLHLPQLRLDLLVLGLLLLSRLVFNLIPFLRLDGYLLLVDLINVPNLRKRAFQYLAALLIPQLRPVAGLRRASRSEKAVFLVYATLASIFTMLTLLSVARVTYAWYIARMNHFGTLAFAATLLAILTLSLLRLRGTMRGLQTAEQNTGGVQ
jgi:hypothetical protein